MKKQKKNKYFLTKKELKTINKKNVVVKMTRQELIKRLIEAKTNDWMNKHPEPPKDLFYDEFKAQWDEDKDLARGRITEKVYAHYCNKIVLNIRYNKKGNYTDYIPFVILKDKYGEVTKSNPVGSLGIDSYLMKKSLKIINNNHSSNIVAYQLLCTNLKTGRLILP